MAYNKLSTYKTKISAVAGVLYHVQYHSTVIVMCYDEGGRKVIELNTGGYQTVTTKRKMNQAAWQFGLGYTVHQRNHEWFVTTKAGVFPFDDRTFVIDVDTGLPYADALPAATRFKAGDRVLFKRQDGVLATDTVREPFTQFLCLAPYAENTEVPALILTEHSWCAVSDVIDKVEDHGFDDGGMAEERARHP